MPYAQGSSSLSAARMTKKYRMFLPEGSKIMNYAVKASGQPCELCGYVPETKPPKPGYPEVSEEMRVMRVRLPENIDSSEVEIGKKDFTVTGGVIEVNVCNSTVDCRERCKNATNEDGSPKYNAKALALFR